MASYAKIDMNMCGRTIITKKHGERSTNYFRLW